jgi:hypothetical protein
MERLRHEDLTVNKFKALGMIDEIKGSFREGYRVGFEAC